MELTWIYLHSPSPLHNGDPFHMMKTIFNFVDMDELIFVCEDLYAP